MAVFFFNKGKCLHLNKYEDFSKLKEIFQTRQKDLFYGCFSSQMTRLVPTLSQHTEVSPRPTHWG